MKQTFDRNQFKHFAENNSVLFHFKCLFKHTEKVRNRSFKSSFISVTDEELEANYQCIGSLRDERIKNLDYMEYNNYSGDFWNPKSAIATNFYPYHACDVYQCNDCHRLFLVYTEYGGHGPNQRMRKVKPELIVEEPSNCVLEITSNNIPKLLDFLKIDDQQFQKMLNESETLDRIAPNFNSSRILVKRWGNYKTQNMYFIVAKRETLYSMIDLLHT